MQKQVVVIAGPSGSGKDSVIRSLCERFPNCVRLVTATTRQPRPGEVNGVDYYFFSTEEFDREMAAGNILEHRFIEALHTNYGTYKPDLEKKLAAGNIIVAHMDIIGARYMKEHYDAATFFIVPASIEELQQRVRSRNPDMPETELNERMRMAQKEIDDHAPEYDHRITNADGKLEATVEKTIEILRKEGYTLES